MIMLSLVLFFVAGLLSLSIIEDYLKYKRAHEYGYSKWIAINLIARRKSLWEKLVVLVVICVFAVIALIIGVM